MTMWNPPTHATAFPATAREPTACPACRRRAAPDMLIDVRTIPVPSVWRPRGAAFICDACRERVSAHGTPASDLLVALGKPA